MADTEYLVRWRPGDAPLSIDGTGGHPAWRTAVVLEDFSFPWLDEAAPRTCFRALRDEACVYFLFQATDSDLVLAGGRDARERVLGSDRVEIFFASGLDLQPYYGLEMDPRGEVLDYRARFHRVVEWDWCCDTLKVRASRNALGYTVEGLVSLATLQQLGCLHEDDEGPYLLAGLFRAEFSRGETGQVVQNWIAWIDPQVPQPDFHVPTAFGRLRLARAAVLA